MTPRSDAMIGNRPPGPMSIESQIYQRVLTFIHMPMDRHTDRDFDRLATEVFGYQFETVRPYRRFCEERGVNPAAVSRVDDIPAVSNVAFKYADLAADDA